MAEENRKGFQQWLDGVDTAASMLAIALLAAITGAVLGGLYYVVTHWPEGYGLGPQGEGFYLAIAFLFVIGWVLAQLTWIMRRRRRNAWTFHDGSEIPLPRITSNKGGFSIQWGARPDAVSGSSATEHTWSGTIPIPAGQLRTFRLDQPALDHARALRASGADWDLVCGHVNPEWSNMDAFDRALYQNALKAAIDATGER